MDDQQMIRDLEAIVEIAKKLSLSGDTVVVPWARQVLVCAYTALQAKSPETAIGDLIEYE